MTDKGDIILIDDKSLEPKYKQIIDAILRCINNGKLQPGDRIPSLNEVSERHYLAKDTVQRAYMELRERGIIHSVPGKGFFIKAEYVDAPVRILLIFNKLTAYKKTIFNAFTRVLSIHATVDLQVHHYDEQIFENIIKSNIGNYHHYVIMPFFYEYTDHLKNLLTLIPQEKLLLLNRNLDFMPDTNSVYEDFKNDVYSILNSYNAELREYKRLFLLFPDDPMSNREIISGFEQFCKSNNIPPNVMTGTSDLDLQDGDLCIVIDDDDLVEVIKFAKKNRLTVGENLGIISYNDTSLKEVLENGISVISTDFEKMGETAAEMILAGKKGKIKNPFKMIRRSSF
jgi:DNA-binding transcriptional regulator YhcF (GntR family)